MNVLPKLVKPYYSLDETFDRLKRMGAELNKVQDIQLLAQERKIELSILCNEHITLLNTKYVIPVKIKWPEFCDNYNVAGLVNFDIYDSGEISELFGGLEREEWLSCDMTLDQTFSDVSCETKEQFAASFHSIDVSSEILIISPINNASVETVGQNVNFFGSDWLLTSKTCALPKKLTVVEVNGERYCVCRHVKGNPLSKGVSFHEEDKKRVTQLFPVLTEDSFLISDYVVTKEEIETFEQTYLGIKHDVNVAKEIVVPIGKLQQREEALKELIEEIGLERLIPMKRIGVWAELTKRDPDLFPFRGKPKDAMVKTFFGESKLISFKRGR
mgnify:CR=1 FL=1